MISRAVIITAYIALTTPCMAASAPAVHYAPIENLEHVDVAEIVRVTKEIDLAAYVLTDWPVIQALTAAAARGVKVRIYLDGGELAASKPFEQLEDTTGVEMRVKPKGEPLMHLKAYQIDGKMLRTGSANFSASGLKRQDNDLVLIESPAAAASFKTKFESIFAQGERFP